MYLSFGSRWLLCHEGVFGCMDTAAASYIEWRGLASSFVLDCATSLEQRWDSVTNVHNPLQYSIHLCLHLALFHGRLHSPSHACSISTVYQTALQGHMIFSKLAALRRHGQRKTDAQRLYKLARNLRSRVEYVKTSFEAHQDGNEDVRSFGR